MSEKPRPKHPMMSDHARRLRHEATPPEQLLWSVLRGRRLAGLKFRRQVPIGQYVADFCCQELRLIVELDGMSHDDKQGGDAMRERWLRKQGYRIFRVTNWDVADDLEAVARGIAREARVPYGG